MGQERLAVDFDAFERAGWRGRSEAYERGMAPLTTHLVEPLLDAARVESGTRVLDVGCGPGGVSAAALARGAHVTAADAEPEMVAATARRLPEVRVHHAILPVLPFADGEFDAVVGNLVINHVGEPPAAVRELRRVVRPGGRVALTSWFYPKMRATVVFDEAVAAVGVPRPADVPATSPFQPYGHPETFTALLTDAGLTGARTEIVEWRHDVDPDAWWTAVLTGTARTAAVIARQNPATLERVRAAYLDLLTPYRTPDGRVSLPAAALLSSATS
ncbi:SAM-dependent methyltransferase [Sphaerisporangium melleum]|uniref:SAM-dependent methyltransferase n=1 Tax=Sphaerisporangium melleum TaxID=321316 RepID=A0A917VHL9_9ACTN|nr:class I SAM-dependent methyltransferase [Sphaerisporangium melleum]GGK78471.1 SAM-dependent methyltransferase [Sphaerisporangium melleum]GII69809.1 SAM-dependent methyltransferase [Sphaerisporangium melleum]